MRTTVEPYGEAAFAALSRTLADARRGDPLCRATVVVPRGSVGLAVRRRLAAGGTGIANVQFATASRLAGELAAGWTGTVRRRPVTPAVLHEAVRGALAEVRDGELAAAAEQPATVRALAQTYRELRTVPAESLRAVAAQGTRASEVVRLVAAVGERLAGWYDHADLLAAATAEVLADPGVARGAGAVVVYLPDRLDGAERALLEALAASVPVTVLVGATGDPGADLPARELVGRLGGHRDHPGFATGVVHGTRVVVAPTADAEVLLAARDLMARHASGTPLERLALVHGGVPPYPRLVHDTLARAGIPFHGTGVRPLAATVAGRTLLGALALPDHRWRRDEVARWLTTAPLLDGGRRVPGHEWDALSAEAGVVGGLDEWRDRLAGHAARLRARDELERSAGGGPPARLRRDAERCDSLRAFVARLAGRLQEAPTTWAAWAAWARRLLRELLGDAPQQAGWPAEEVAALDAVLAVVDGLAQLGDRLPAAADVRAAVAVELEAGAPETSRFGHGVLVGRVADVVGLHLDALWVVGMADGAFPGPAADDVLLPDRERQAGGPEVPLRGAGPAQARRDFLAALASAPERVLSYAAGDQRQGRAQRPARLLLDTVGELAGAGRRLFAGDLAAAGGHHAVPSFAAAVASTAGEPVSPDDWDLRSLVGWVDAGGSPADHPLGRADPVLAAGLELRRGRRGTTFSRFDGRVGDAAAAAGTPAGTAPGDREQSPTRLEAYARCPRRYLFESLLGVAVRERPESLLRIGPLERGAIVHRVLERFVAAALDGPPVEPEASWGEAGDERLRAIAGEVFDEHERRGLTGRPSLWQVDRAAILGDLRRFLGEDDRYRREAGAVPVAVEQPFGHGGQPGVAVPVAGGRHVTFRGTVDRVDRTAGGGLSVLDYKTGRRPDPVDDPVAGGTRLQLPLYALAARQRYRPAGPVDVRYWYVSDRGSDRGRSPRDGFTMTDGTERRLAEVVGAMVEGVAAGRFPGNPEGCALCPYTDVCPPDRGPSWERKRDDPWVTPYLALAEPA